MPSPYINHFIQPDTIIPNPSNPQSLNRYGYVGNNPVRFSDPTGHKACETKEDCYDMGISPNGGNIYNDLMKEKEEPEVNDPEDMHLSDKGRDFIFFWESFYERPYNDGPNGTGNCTIGYGTLLHLGPCDGRDRYWKDNPISTATAQSWANNAILASEQIIKDTVNAKLTQSQFDVLVSYIYNAGGQPGQPFLEKGIPELLNDGKYYEVALAIDSGPYTGKNIGYAPGLERRRHEEAAIFLFGP